MAFYRMSGSSKGELHGASILVTVDGGTSGETVTLTKGTFSKSGKLSEDLTCLFTDLLEAGTYTATYQTFTASVEVSASDILNKVTKSVTVATSTTTTLTLEGAKEDTITITDKTGATVGVCVFPTDSVTGTVEIEIPPEGGAYTFTSSVAKDIETGTSNYSKNVTLTNSSSKVNVFPTIISGYGDLAYMPWYKNYSMGYSHIIPQMTSNTTPSGECIRDSASISQYSGEAYNAFNRDISTLPWSSGAFNTAGINTSYIGYKFDTPITLKAFKASLNSGNEVGIDVQPQYSVDGITWNNFGDIITPLDHYTSPPFIQYANIPNVKSVRFLMVTSTGTSNRLGAREIFIVGE